MAKTSAQLTEPLLALLQKERLVTLSTIDHETGAPYVHALSWVFAPDTSVLRLAVDNSSKIIHNISHNKSVVINLFGAGSCYAIVGQATIAAEKLQGVPIKLAQVDVKITEVRDVMFYGSRISTEPEYEKIYDQEAADKLDRQVMEALRA